MLDSISLDPGKLGNHADQLRGLNQLARDVLAVLAGMITQDLPHGKRPVICDIWEEPYPQTDVVSDTHSPYRIHIGRHDQSCDWCMIAYQLAHELGHVILGPNVENNLCETIRIALSLEVLDRLCDLYSARDDGMWGDRDYPKEFRVYRERAELRSVSNMQPNDTALTASLIQAIELRDDKPLVAFLHEQIPSFDVENYRSQLGNRRDFTRGLEMIGAIALRFGDVNWNDFVGLVQRMHPTEWNSHTLRSIKPDNPPLPVDVLRRLGRGTN